MENTQADEITIQQIRIFLAAAQHGNFTAAAQRLHLTQPAVSKWIAKLERQLDCKLFERQGTGVVLTRKGEVLLDKWQKLAVDFSASLAALELSGESKETIRIGCLPQLRYDDTILKLLEDYGKRNRQIEILLETHDLKDLSNLLYRRALDAILTYSFDFIDNDRVRVVPMHKADLFLVGTTRTMEDETSEGYHSLLLLSRAESPHGSEEAISACRAMGYAFERIIYYPNMSTLEMAMRQGKGAMICGGYVFQKGDALLGFPVPKEHINNHISLVWFAETEEPSVKALAQCAEAIKKQAIEVRG